MSITWTVLDPFRVMTNDTNGAPNGPNGPNRDAEQAKSLALASFLSNDFSSGEQWFLDTCLRAGLSMPNARFATQACFEARRQDSASGFFRGAQFILQLVGAQAGTRAALEDILRSRGLLP